MSTYDTPIPKARPFWSGFGAGLLAPALALGFTLLVGGTPLVWLVAVVALAAGAVSIGPFSAARVAGVLAGSVLVVVVGVSALVAFIAATFS